MKKDAEKKRINVRLVRAKGWGVVHPEVPVDLGRAEMPVELTGEQIAEALGLLDDGSVAAATKLQVVAGICRRDELPHIRRRNESTETMGKAQYVISGEKDIVGTFRGYVRGTLVHAAHAANFCGIEVWCSEEREEATFAVYQIDDSEYPSFKLVCVEEGGPELLAHCLQLNLQSVFIA